MFHHMTFFYMKLCMQYPGHNYFFDTSCYFVIYPQFQNASQKYNYHLHFSSPSPTLTNLLGNMCFLQRVQKVMSVGCLLVDFDPCCLFRFVVIMIDN